MDVEQDYYMSENDPSKMMCICYNSDHSNSSMTNSQAVNSELPNGSDESFTSQTNSIFQIGEKKKQWKQVEIKKSHKVKAKLRRRINSKRHVLPNKVQSNNPKVEKSRFAANIDQNDRDYEEESKDPKSSSCFKRKKYPLKKESVQKFNDAGSS